MIVAANPLHRAVCRTYPFRRGRWRLIDLMRRRVGGRVLGRDMFGQRLLLDLGNYVDCMVYLDGAYEKESVLALEAVAREHGCRAMVDVGANIGCYTLFFARRLGLDPVLAFEPMTRHYRQLQANLWLNDLGGRVQTHQLALSDHGGEAVMHQPPTRRRNGVQFNTGGARVLDEAEAAEGPGEGETFRVPLVRFDERFTLDRPTLIKIDVEGHELAVLRGMPAALAGPVRVLMVESAPPNLTDVTALLSGHGFRRRDELRLPCDNWVFVKDPAGGTTDA
ncbi:MAG: FkbM family methyltransferase [Planctomycetota bacterium]